MNAYYNTDEKKVYVGMSVLQAMSLKSLLTQNSKKVSGDWMSADSFDTFVSLISRVLEKAQQNDNVV